MHRFVLAALMAMLVSVTPAHAAEPWSAPQTVSSAAGRILDARLVVDADGRDLAAWTSQGPIPDVKSGYPTSALVAVREPGAAQFGPEQSDPWVFGAPVFYGRDRVLAFGHRYEDRTDEFELYAKFGDTRGKIDFTQEITSYSSNDSIRGPDGRTPASLAVHHNAIAAWVQGSSLDRGVVRASIRPLGGKFGPVVTLRRGRDLKGVIAGSGPGIVFVAWERGDVLEARVKRRGRGWEPVQRVGVTYSDVYGATLKVMFSGKRAYLAWAASGAGEYTLRVAVLPGGRTRFRRARRIDLVGQELKPYSRPIALVPLAGHGALLGWTGWDGQRARAYAARTGRGARFGRRVAVSPPGEPAVLGDLEVIPDGAPGAGTVLALWTRLDDRGLGDRVRAALRLRGGAFAPPEDVSDLDRAGLSVDAAFDPVGRRWTVVWPQTLGPPVLDYMAATHLRSATRPG